MLAFGKTDTGKVRTTNQDTIFLSVTPVGKLPNLFIVADGMGGHKAGDVASKSAVDTVIEAIKECTLEAPVSILDNAINMANKKLLELSTGNEDLEGMGTTLVIVTIEEEAAYIGNIGDSRLYIIDDEIEQITRDHSFVEEMVNLGKLDKDSARTHIRKNVLTRALGVDLKTGADFFEIQCTKGMKFLLCSDGLTNMIEDKDIKNIVLNTKTEDTAGKLIDIANENGGTDNISSIIIEL